MILNREDALYAANVFVDYFSNFGRIDDYLRKVKMERMANYPTALPGMGPHDEMFSDFNMHPEDMEFECRQVDNDKFMYYLEVVTSHAIESSIPGKSMRYIVYEKNTGKMVGFIRLGSPTINSKPRNVFLGRTLDNTMMTRFNESTIMGFIIVPTQPFGFNYLGGKLLAGICCSHLVKDDLDKKYGGPFCMFETTSLYGSTKGVSQYDGMKPYLRYKGNTESDFAPMINDDNYRRLNDWFVKRNGGAPLIEQDASSRKLKTQTKMVAIIKNSLRTTDPEAYKNFEKVCLDAKGLTEKKRQYMSDYGYANVKEYLTMETDTLVKKDNFDSYNFENVVTWWKKKASKRFENLKDDDRLRKTIEVWNKNAESIDIIR